MASPIQVVLNPENYQEARETAGGGGRKDFFAHRDNEFRIHRSALISQIDTISEVLSAQRQGDIGFAKVVLRREAWAKRALSDQRGRAGHVLLADADEPQIESPSA